MADRPRGFGMTAELAEKKNAKFDIELAEQVFSWIEAVGTRAGTPPGLGPAQDMNNIGQKLKDGKVLCQLVNNIKPGTVRKVNDSKMAFKQMENIGFFLSGCESLGVNKVDMFQTVDLYECQNIPQVINGIMALARKAQTIGYSGPTLGPAESTENRRSFTEEQLRAGEGVIGLQAGSNKGASQAGQTFGKSRMIID